MTAGYSGTPLAKKLGIKAEHRLVLLHAPSGWEVPELPGGVRVLRRGMAGDVIVAFYRSRRELVADSAKFTSLAPGCALWIAWPRKAGGHVSDIAEQDLRDLLLPTGLVDVKVAALDNDWSGLKFLWRSTR
ncbi:DUF3052 domain-containing protein [Amycolatopsis sp. NPDC059657]|uniref:DUF3052 domain-containing protein n=1 Tax=Amycolatopsis sp. NPDC059657 TaxID=3346899 RepID=UPI00366D79D8